MNIKLAGWNYFVFNVSVFLGSVVCSILMEVL